MSLLETVTMFPAGYTAYSFSLWCLSRYRVTPTGRNTSFNTWQWRCSLYANMQLRTHGFRNSATNTSKCHHSALTFQNFPGENPCPTETPLLPPPIILYKLSAYTSFQPSYATAWDLSKMAAIFLILCIFLKGNLCVLIYNFIEVCTQGLTDNKSALV